MQTLRPVQLVDADLNRANLTQRGPDLCGVGRCKSEPERLCATVQILKRLHAELARI